MSLGNNNVGVGLKPAPTNVSGYRKSYAEEWWGGLESRVEVFLGERGA